MATSKKSTKYRVIAGLIFTQLSVLFAGFISASFVATATESSTTESTTSATKATSTKSVATADESSTIESSTTKATTAANAYIEDKPLKPCQALKETSDASLLFTRILSRKLTFALLGAHDGVANDHAYKLAVKHRWSGVAVEAHVQHFRSARDAYRLSGLDVDVLNAAVCAIDRVNLPFFYVDTSNLPFPWWVKQISSLSKQHILNHNRLLDRAPTSCGNAGLPDTCLRNKIVERLRVIQVPCAFAHSLAKKYQPELLISDVEGVDDQMVGSWLEVQKPKYIIAEIKNLAKPREFLNFLEAQGYCVRDDNHDAYAILI